MSKFNLKSIMFDYTVIFGGFISANIIYTLYLYLINASRDVGIPFTFLISCVFFLFISVLILASYYVIKRILNIGQIPRKLLFTGFLIITLITSVIWEIIRDPSTPRNEFTKFYFNNNTIIDTVIWILFLIGAAVYIKSKNGIKS